LNCCGSTVKVLKDDNVDEYDAMVALVGWAA